MEKTYPKKMLNHANKTVLRCYDDCKDTVNAVVNTLVTAEAGDDELLVSKNLQG